MRSEKDKMLAGELYRATGPELAADSVRAGRLLRVYNRTGADETVQRLEIFRELLGAIAEDAVVRSPFYCDYGYNTHVAAGVFVNFGCVFLDVVRIDIGEGCQIGPYVETLTADHPRDPALRQQRLESSKAVTLGRNVWIGGDAIVLPGVMVGDDAIVGARSVVTRDVAPGVTVMGNPARSSTKLRAT